MFLPVLDHLTSSLQGGIDAYSVLNKNFEFLLNIPRLSPDDLEKELEEEIVHFSSITKGLLDKNLMDATNTFEIDMYLQLIENELDEAFSKSNVAIMFKIYWCRFVTNCKGEHSFLKVKLLKNHLRNTMGQDRLSALAILAIENELLKTIDFSDIISEFAEAKCRRKSL